MPMTFTDKMVEYRSKLLNVESTREAVATAIEEKYEDYVEGWEIRTGRPWNTMTRDEARELINQHPKCSRNPGVLSRLLS